MRTLKLKYRFRSEFTFPESPPYQRRILRPAIKIRLSHLSKTTNFFDALLDSGADMNSFHTEIAEYLDIDWRNCPSVLFKGIGGVSVKNFIHKVKIEIGSYRYETEVGFMENLPRPGLLGLYGFFDRFAVFLNRGKGIIQLSFKEEKGCVVLE